MASKTQYAMHEDYKKIPSFNFPFNRLAVGLVNGFLAWDRYRSKSSADARVERREQEIATRDGDSFKLIIMRPKGLTDSCPAVLYYHGGAFAFSYASMHLQSCERYAVEANCCVVVVDYRLGPSKPFPSGFDDCYQTLEWVRENADELKIDSIRIAVMGDSAGGGLSAGVAQKALDNSVPLCAQILIYPTLDYECKTTSATEFADTPIWNAGSNRNMWKMYLKNTSADAPPAYAAPGHRDNLVGLAPAYVETAEFDPLHDEGAEYAERLKEQGVEVEYNPTSGTIHGYEMAAKNPETIRSMKERIAYLLKRFGN